MNDSQFPITTAVGQGVVNILHVVETSVCAHCRQQVHRYGVAIGAPYHAILHRHCAAAFDYANGWPHAEPLASYVSTGGGPLPMNPPQLGMGAPPPPLLGSPPSPRYITARRDSVSSVGSHHSCCSSCQHCGR